MKEKSQKVLVIPIVALIIGFSIFMLVRSNKPTSSDSTQTKEEALIVEQPFIFDGSQLIIENEFSIVSFTNFSIYDVDPENRYFPSVELAKEISQVLELNQVDENTWQDGIYTVTYLPSDLYIRIKIKTDSSKKVTLTEALVEEKSEEILKEFNIWPFFGEDYEKKISIFEEANLEGTAAKIIFNQKLNDMPVYTNILNNAEIYVEFNEAGEVSEVRYFHIPNKRKESKIELKSAEEIKRSLEIGRFSKVDSSIDFTKLKVNETDGVYYISPLSSTIQPVFLVNGQNEFGEEIEVLVPALKESQYK